MRKEELLKHNSEVRAKREKEKLEQQKQSETKKKAKKVKKTSVKIEETIAENLEEVDIPMKKFLVTAEKEKEFWTNKE